MTADEEQSLIGEALATLANEVYQHHLNSPERGPRYTGEPKLHPGPIADAAAMLLCDPIDGAHRLAIRLLGERLSDLGGMKFMGWATDYATSVPGPFSSFAEGLIDHAWDGIGGWAA